MRYHFITLMSVFVFLLGFTAAEPAFAGKPKYVFKIASLAPDGSVWAKRFKDFANEINEKTNGEVGFKLYPGGVMGDDRSMYRKLRIGQIQGGGFTMTGIGDYVADFRVLSIPFLFESYEEVDYVIKGLIPTFKKAFDEKNLVLVGMSEVGFMYAMSTSPLMTIADLKKSKVWVPEGDPISNEYIKEIGVSPTQLSIPDVLTSLQTGLVDTVFNSFYGSIVLQWFTRTKYITNIPFAYSYGAITFDKRSYEKLPGKYKEILDTAAQKHFSLMLNDSRKSDTESLQVLKENGIKLIEPPAKTKKDLKQFRDQMIDRLVDTAFSKEIYGETKKLLTDFRAKNNNLKISKKQ